MTPTSTPKSSPARGRVHGTGRAVGVTAILLSMMTSSATIADEKPTIARPSAFPPPNTSHYLAGELTMVDHVNRMGILRPDRLDDYKKNHLDLPHHFAMLPYGTVTFHGAPATLKDVPLGTHLHGALHLGPKGEYDVALQPTDYQAQVRNQPNAFSPESPFNQALTLEDDFSFYQRRGKRWKVLSVDREQGKLVAELVDSKSPTKSPEKVPFPEEFDLEGPQTFDINAATRIWKGLTIGRLDDIAPGQETLFNLTWATIYGPGRITDLWLDKESQAIATERQRRGYLEHLKIYGVPVLVEKVDHHDKGAGTVTAHLYAGPDEEMLSEFRAKTNGRFIVVESNLRSHDQGNDAKGYRLEAIVGVDNPPPGSGGKRWTLHMSELLEGVRPGRTICLKAPNWSRVSIPREERLWPFDIRPQFLERGASPKKPPSS
ncbi:hypothetical protein Pan216_51840 [Planctomycetes bacterium Pan216]|uniref:Uncharacterized protein n=1 Tax=Kolteria novifilia TaxID=2527975 RepID=A0A518BBC5_9BACT|nr:hypothetical protein Pan216_51840 [Planctomycetes bacterium Pan216]